MNTLSWDLNAWEDCLHWQKQNKTILKRINLLVRDTLRNPTSGFGKPERLRQDLSGYYSRRITEEHRLVYKIYENRIHIIQCRLHN